MKSATPFSVGVGSACFISTLTGLAGNIMKKIWLACQGFLDPLGPFGYNTFARQHLLSSCRFSLAACSRPA
jgi:hypothetical protein